MSFDWRKNLEEALKEYADNDLVPLLMQFELQVPEWRKQAIEAIARRRVDGVFEEGGVRGVSITLYDSEVRPPEGKKDELEYHEDLIENDLIAAGARKLRVQVLLDPTELYAHAFIPCVRIREDIAKRNDLMCAVVKDGNSVALTDECVGKRETPHLDKMGHRVYQRVTPFFQQLSQG